MPTYTQANSPIVIKTPLSEDALLLTRIDGREEISRLFQFKLELLAEKEREIRFEDILGQCVTVEIALSQGGKRYLHGLVKSFSQGITDEAFVHYRAEIVPRLWLLTKKVRSRIFQHVTIPDLLYQLFSGLDVTYEISGKYFPRDYCVQYRESDFDFASRLMEEEGIYYFFAHGADRHYMIVSDAPFPGHIVPGQSKIPYQQTTGGLWEQMHIERWQKTQELRAGEYTLWDHCFELPGYHLEARAKTLESVSVGSVVHKLQVGQNDQLEIYDYPGGYAQRFDGVGPDGVVKSGDLQGIFQDRERTVRIRIEQEEAESLRIEGAGDCTNFTAGHKFTLGLHFNADGEYLLTSVDHHADWNGYRSRDQEMAFHYENRFTAVPAALRYRPQRVTPKPVIAGVQTATVAGPSGEDIFCDKYGRVKVQFHWDRDGKYDAGSSCWVRVSQVWAGKGWGAFFWPRIGHEVVVIFEEGDPDQPLIVGSVYNAENMPWFALPENKKLAGIKSESVRGVANRHFNGIVFNDEKGREHLSIYSERNLSLDSEFDKMIHAGRHKGERVAIANVLTVGKLIPGGGSGGGFDEGNPLPQPPPTGVVGMSSVVTYGSNMQTACPQNTQLAVGNNLQLCVNPFGVAAGCSAPLPGLVSAILGGGMGGNMQFTFGTSAQFTLGQSFEISVGPPKVEIHTQYKGHVPVILLSGILGAAAIAFVIAYDLLKHEPDPYNPATDSNSPAALAREIPGDKQRATLALVFQLVADAALALILGIESLIDKTDWFADDIMKRLFSADASCFTLWRAPDVTPDPVETGNFWTDWGALVWGSIGVVAAVAAEIEVVGKADL